MAGWDEGRRAAPDQSRVMLAYTRADVAELNRLARERLHALPERVSVSVVVADWRAREVRALVSGAWGEEARAREKTWRTARSLSPTYWEVMIGIRKGKGRRGSVE